MFNITNKMLTQKKLILSATVVTMVAIMAMTPEKSSSGAPAGHTGAPGEGTCATIGCHDDNSVNSGQAQLDIDFGAITHYVPGQTYPIKVRISDASVERFGFQVVALVDGDTSNAGTFLITDSVRTQTTKSAYQFQSREYVTYSYNGTDAVNTGLGEWTMNWKAPSTNKGAITFYASGVSANDDENDQGDHVYTKSKVLLSNYKVTELQK